MPETNHTEENIAYIRTHVERVEQMQRFAIAANPGSKEFVREALESRKGAAEVYLQLSNGPKGLDDIASELKASKPTVSKICTHLLGHGFITKVPDPENSKSFKYYYTDVEALLGVSKIAKRLAKKS